MTDMTTRRATAVLALTGGVVALVGNLLAPRFNGDDVQVYRKVADSTRFTVSDVIVLAAVLLVTAAFVGISRPGPRALSVELRSLGRLATVAGGTIAVLETGVALYAYRQQAIAFADANSNNAVAAFWATNAIDHVMTAMFSVWTLLLLGLAPLLLGAAQLRDRSVSVLIATLGVVGGLVCAVVGVAELLTDTPSDFDIPFLVGSLLVTLWLLATGVVLWRVPDLTLVGSGTTEA